MNWRIVDATRAAKMAADTMRVHVEGQPAPVVGSDQNSILRKDVLKQAVASLAAAIGGVRYADEVHVSANEKINVDTADVLPAQVNLVQACSNEPHGVSQIFSVQQMSSAVQHANEICNQYGVSIISINVISAVPFDKKLEETLSAGAVAAAGAQQAEIAARGNAKARLIDAQSCAAAQRVQAQAAADAEVMHAQGKKEAAALLEGSQVAVDLAKLEKTGGILSNKTSFFFGTAPPALPALLGSQKIMQNCTHHDYGMQDYVHDRV
jgi:regulator of protease activity HflC (stomatin/prohibitin superfamily)